MALAEETRTVSEDGSTAMAVVTFTAEQQAVTAEEKEALQAAVDGTEIEGVQVEYSLEIAQDISQLVGPAEVIGVVIAGIVLLVMLGTLVAARALRARRAIDLGRLIVDVKVNERHVVRRAELYGDSVSAAVSAADGAAAARGSVPVPGAPPGGWRGCCRTPPAGRFPRRGPLWFPGRCASWGP